MRLRCEDCNNETKFVKVVSIKKNNKFKIAITKWDANLTQHGEKNHGQWDKHSTKYKKVNSAKGKAIFCIECKSDNVIVYATPDVDPYK